MGSYAIITNIIPEEPDEEQDIIESECEEKSKLLLKDEYFKIDELYDECLNYLKGENIDDLDMNNSIELDYESITDKQELKDENEVTYDFETQDETTDEMETKEELIEDISTAHNAKIADKEVIEEIFGNIPKDTVYKVENELRSTESINSAASEPRSERLRKLSQQLPKIIITQSNTSLNVRRHDEIVLKYNFNAKPNKIKPYFERKDDKKDVKGKIISNEKKKSAFDNNTHPRKPLHRSRPGCGDFPKRLVSKRGIENVALISNVPFEKIRMLNDTFHTLINLRWRWIVSGTIVVHFAIWLIFAVFWYITALAHYDFEPDPPKKTCITGGYDFLTIFLASVEAQTTIGFGDRAIDEECPESIFLFIMQLILGTGLSGVLTCVVYAKLTRPEKLSRDGVGFSKKAVISMRDGRLCLMLRAWDLNYDHIISSEFTAHFVHTHRTKEGEIVRYYAQTLSLQQRQFLLWPVTLVHVIDSTSPLYRYGPEHISNSNYEITVSLKGASASMGTFTQSQTSYLPKEVLWGHRFPPVVKYDSHKQKYVIDQKKLNNTEPVDTPFCSAEEVYENPQDPPDRPQTPSSFSEKITSFQLGRSSSFRTKTTKG